MLRVHPAPQQARRLHMQGGRVRGTRLYSRAPAARPPNNEEPEDRHQARDLSGAIFALQHYWSARGCVILQPYDMEVGAGTFHSATFLRSIGPEPWSAAYVQPSRRPTDGRYGAESVPSAALLPVPGVDQTLAAGSASSCTSTACAHSASIRAFTTCASSRTTGSRRRSGPGGWAGRSGSTAWRSRSSPTSSRSADSTAAPSPARSPMARAAGDVSAGRGEHLRHHLDRRAAGTRELRRRVSSERGRTVAATISSTPTRPCCCATSMNTRRPAPRCWPYRCRCPPMSRCSRPRIRSICSMRAARSR